jgi:hypothetical protein
MSKANKDDFVYVSVPIFKSGLNANGDIYPEQDLRNAGKHFTGKPVSTKNSPSADDICGFIADTHFDEEKKSVIGLLAIDKENYPKIAKMIEAKECGFEFGNDCVSMSIKKD